MPFSSCVSFYNTPRTSDCEPAAFAGDGGRDGHPHRSGGAAAAAAAAPRAQEAGRRVPDRRPERRRGPGPPGALKRPQRSP
jgi:hypothetical protein